MMIIMNKPKYVTARVFENKKLSKTIYLIKTKTLDNIPEPLPPQFVMLWLPGYEAIPMSIAHYENNEVWFIVKPIGLTTKKLVEVNPGEYVGLIGPLGKPLLPIGEKYLYIAGGSGLAPILHYIQRTRSKKCKLIYGAWSFEEIGEVKTLFRKINCDVVTTCLDNECDYKGLVTDYFVKENLDRYDYVIACGPIDMLKKLAGVIDRRNWFKTLLIIETIVKCGLNLCGSCRVFKNMKKYLCIEGPGFYLSEIGDCFE